MKCRSPPENRSKVLDADADADADGVGDGDGEANGLAAAGLLYDVQGGDGGGTHTALGADEGRVGGHG